MSRRPASSSELARAIKYAITHGASVISMSLGYGAPSLPVRSALQDALNHNVVVVASSGNSGDAPSAQHSARPRTRSRPTTPACSGWRAVGQNGAPADFSSDNLSVQVAAPGVERARPGPATGSTGW